MRFAKESGQKWLEVPADTIQILQPKGMGKAGYFIYGGIKVCETGTLEMVQNEEYRDINRDIFGPKEATLLVGNQHLHPGESTVK